MQDKLKSYATALLILVSAAASQSAVTKKDMERMSLSAKKAPPPSSAQHEVLENLELPTVPSLIGKDPKDPTVVKELLKGTGFTVLVAGSEKSETVPKGAVISQKPAEYSEVRKAGVIKVVISAGK